MRPWEFRKLASSPDSFFAAIPKKFERNLIFRKDLHMLLAQDSGCRTEFLALAFLDPRIFFDTCFWCPGTEMQAKSRNMPFILYPKQEVAVLAIKEALDSGKSDLVLNKSRKQGATFIICGVGTIYWLLVSGFQFFLGSRDEKHVDTSSEIINNIVVGDEKSVFYKILYLLNTLPDYLKPNYRKSHMFIQNLNNGSAISGEATGVGFGCGSRAPLIMVDELALVEPKIADKTITNLADVGGCCVFNSTHGPWGASHPYNKLIVGGRAKVVDLWWWDNPTQNVGLYRSPAEGVVAISDVDYYRSAYPGSFDDVVAEQPYDVSRFIGTYPFVADGGISTWNGPRSVWADEDLKRPGRTPQGIAQNLYGVATGSSDVFFQPRLVADLKDRTKAARTVGDIKYELKEDGKTLTSWFEPGGSNGLLSWWGPLDVLRRPNQNHNYVVGCDISRGTGTSNSVAAVLDVNAREVVGLLVTPHHRVEKFAELVVALCLWVGGREQPLLIWEENGASEFWARLRELDYYNLWRKPGRDGDKAYGWRSTSGINGTKIALMNRLDSALHEGLKNTSPFDRVCIYDTNTINELSQYVFFEGRLEVGSVSSQLDSSGAKAAHGDRVIATGLAVLGAATTEAGVATTELEMPKEGTFAARMAEVEQAKQEEARIGRIWVF